MTGIKPTNHLTYTLPIWYTYCKEIAVGVLVLSNFLDNAHV